MKNKELFHKTVGILVRAYQNDTLLHGACHACAVGNLIAGNNNMRPDIGNTPFFWIDKNGNKYNPLWTNVHSYGEISTNGILDARGVAQLESTGYSILETAKIEEAFEYKGQSLWDYRMVDKDGFNGLMSVIDTLMEIHQCSEVEAQEAKAMFVKV